MASAPDQKHSSSSGGIFAQERDLWGTNSPSNPANTPAENQTQASAKASEDAKPRDPQPKNAQASKPESKATNEEYISNGALVKHS